jgi:hypothetical protein
MKRIVKNIFESLFFLLVFYLLGNVGIGYYFLAPFGISVLFALLLQKYKIFMASVCYFIANTLSQFSLKGMYVSITVVFVVIITYFLLKRCKIIFAEVVEKANLKGINEVFLLKVKESQIYFQKNS